MVMNGNVEVVLQGNNAWCSRETTENGMKLQLEQGQIPDVNDHQDWSPALLTKIQPTFNLHFHWGDEFET